MYERNYDYEAGHRRHRQHRGDITNINVVKNATSIFTLTLPWAATPLPSHFGAYGVPPEEAQRILVEVLKG
jgi:hypothetical protein